ncbi:MAG: hypothetical protein M0C28_35175 [Candidatus Moduliflexus flocculans]|nr:hypothetical protein [Candidatus Moduliflexus flocculans]
MFITEVVASIARKQDSTEIALEMRHELRKIPNLTLVDLDDAFADFAAGNRRQTTARAAVTRSMRRSLCGSARN